MNFAQRAVKGKKGTRTVGEYKGRMVYFRDSPDHFAGSRSSAPEMCPATPRHLLAALAAPAPADEGKLRADLAALLPRLPEDERLPLEEELRAARGPRDLARVLSQAQAIAVQYEIDESDEDETASPPAPASVVPATVPQPRPKPAPAPPAPPSAPPAPVVEEEEAEPDFDDPPIVAPAPKTPAPSAAASPERQAIKGEYRESIAVNGKVIHSESRIMATAEDMGPPNNAAHERPAYVVDPPRAPAPPAVPEDDAAKARRLVADANTGKACGQASIAISRLKDLSTEQRYAFGQQLRDKKASLQGSGEV
jgi:hypothetical protein